jgi:hypothetical protein
VNSDINVNVNVNVNVNANVNPSNEFSEKKIDSSFENAQHMVKRRYCTQTIDIECIPLKQNINRPSDLSCKLNTALDQHDFHRDYEFNETVRPDATQSSMNQRSICVFQAIRDGSAQLIHSELAAVFGSHAIIYSIVILSGI